MISCSEAVRQLWDFLENDLAEEDKSRVEEHLAFCRRCCGEAEFADELAQLLRSASRPHLPEEVERRLVGFLDDLEGETQ